MQCHQALWLQSCLALWSNCKRTQSSKSGFFLCNKYELLLSWHFAQSTVKRFVDSHAHSPYISWFCCSASLFLYLPPSPSPPMHSLSERFYVFKNCMVLLCEMYVPMTWEHGEVSTWENRHGVCAMFCLLLVEGVLKVALPSASSLLAYEFEISFPCPSSWLCEVFLSGAQKSSALRNPPFLRFALTSPKPEMHEH